MRLILSIDLAGAAFDTDDGAEVSRILLDVAREFSTGERATGNPFMLLDENGNVCGSVEYRALRCGVCKGTGLVGRMFNVCLACQGRGR